ncbi:MAG: hypothetical protein J3R72DRAFT_450238 [Linnemannia gamsii]|nr:MAG: hypothetical protein J3R72DRAFT_450238 [Linnemannia gamsii]
MAWHSRGCVYDFFRALNYLRSAFVFLLFLPSLLTPTLSRSFTHHTHKQPKSSCQSRPSLAPKPAETMSSSRKILVAFIATVAFIGLTDPALGAPT